MKILMLGWEFPPYMSGGLGTACYHLTKNISCLGTQIVFVVPQLKAYTRISVTDGLEVTGVSGTVLPDYYNKKRIAFFSQNLWNNHLQICSIDSPLQPYDNESLYTFRLDAAHASLHSDEAHRKDGTTVIQLDGAYGDDLLAEVQRYSKAVAEVFLHEQFDLVHAHDWMTYPAGMLLKQLTRKPLVVHAHALEVDRSGQNQNPAIAHIERAGMTAADRVIAVSHYTKSEIIREYAIPENKITVAHNAVPRHKALAQYKVPPLFQDEKRVLFMGRVTFQKGPDYFVEAARLVLDSMANVRFIMAGSGDMLTRMIRRVAQLRMGRQFNFTGFLTGEDVDRIYAMSDLYVMPSVSEPFGIAPLEAMMSDVPVIIAKQSGVREVIPRAPYVDFWDVREMANKICAVLSYPALSNMIVANCAQELKNIRWENTASIIHAVYSQLVPGR